MAGRLLTAYYEKLTRYTIAVFQYRIGRKNDRPV